MSRQKHQSLSLHKKVETIRAVDNALQAKKKEIAAEFCIPANTLLTVLRNCTAIMSNDAKGAVDPKRKRFRSKYEDLDKALLKWFCGAKDQNVPISGPILLTKAKEFAKKLGNRSFQGSAG